MVKASTFGKEAVIYSKSLRAATESLARSFGIAQKNMKGLTGSVAKGNAGSIIYRKSLVSLMDTANKNNISLKPFIKSLHELVKGMKATSKSPVVDFFKLTTKYIDAESKSVDILIKKTKQATIVNKAYGKSLLEIAQGLKSYPPPPKLPTVPTLPKQPILRSGAKGKPPEDSIQIAKEKKKALNLIPNKPPKITSLYKKAVKDNAPPPPPQSKAVKSTVQSSDFVRMISQPSFMKNSFSIAQPPKIVKSLPKSNIVPHPTGKLPTPLEPDLAFIKEKAAKVAPIPIQSKIGKAQKDIEIAKSWTGVKPSSIGEKIRLGRTLNKKKDDDEYTSFGIGGDQESQLKFDDKPKDIDSAALIVAAIIESAKDIVDSVLQNAEKVADAIAGEKVEVPQAKLGKSRAKAGLKGFGLGTGITPFVSGIVGKVKGFAAEKGITGGGKAQTLGAVAGVGAKGIAKATKALGKKAVMKTFKVMGKMGGALKGGAAAGAGALLGVFRAMAPFKALGDSLTSSFGALGSIMAAQFAPVIGDLVTTILTPENIKIFEDLGQALLPIVSGVADLFAAVLGSEEFKGFMDGIIEAVDALFAVFDDPAVQEALKSVAAGLLSMATGFFEILAELMPSLNPLIIAFSGLLTDLFAVFNDPEVKGAIKLVVDNLIDMAINFIKALSTLLPVIIPLLIPVITFLSDIGLFVSDVVLNLAKLLADNKTTIIGIFNGIIGFLNGAIGIINDLIAWTGYNIPLIKEAAINSNPTVGGNEPPPNIGISEDEDPLANVKSLDLQGSVLATGYAKVHAGERVLKDELLKVVVREAMTVTNNFNGQVSSNERREFSRSMKQLWDN